MPEAATFRAPGPSNVSCTEGRGGWRVSRHTLGIEGEHRLHPDVHVREAELLEHRVDDPLAVGLRVERGLRQEDLAFPRVHP